MAQCFKLVNAGFVDKVIVFDELPDKLLQGVRTRGAEGFPRSWAKWLASIGSVRDVMKTETTVHPDRQITFKYTPIGKEPCFFVLDYQDINADKESWRQISDYLRQHCGEKVRLKEKIEDMAVVLAPNAHVALDVEPEDIPVIPLPSDIKEEVKEDATIAEGEQIVIRKRGRPRKEVVEA